MGKQTETLIVKGSLGQALSFLALPTLGAQLVQSMGWLGEAYFVQKLGEAATAAVGAVGQAGWLLMVFNMMVSVGATTLTAQRWGAGDLKGVRQVVTTTLQQGLFFGTFAMPLWWFKEPFWQWLGISPTIQRFATVYFAAAVLSFPVVSLTFSLMALYRGLGDMVTPLAATLVGVFVQLLLCAFLVPHYGIAGAAWALGISRGAALLLLLWQFPRSPLKIPSVALMEWHSLEHRNLLVLGLPSGVQSFLWSLASTFYFALLAHTKESTAALAALTVGLRVEALAFMPGIAFGIAAQTLVGQNIGARQLDRARKGAWQAALWCSLIMGLVGAFFFAAADWLASRFTNDPTTHRYIAAYLQINAISEPFLALGMTLGGALRGIGDTLTPAVIGVASQWFVRLPTTYALCHWLGYDTIAAWWTMSLSTILSGILTAWAFKWRVRQLR